MRKVAVVLALLAVVGVASADKVLDSSPASLTSPFSGGVRALPYATGFEPAEGFVPGYIGGQQGWSTFTGTTLEAHVDTVNPAAGEQHMRISYEPNLGAGSLVGAFSPDQGPLGAGQYSMAVDVNIGGTGGADYDIVAQAPSQGYLTFRVKNYWSDFDGDGLAGDVLYLDSTLNYADTGFDYTPGVYYNLEVVVDSLAGTIDYYIDGGLVASDVVFAGTSIEQAVFLSDNYNLGESGDFDNLIITPEPASLLLLGLAGLLIRRR